MRAKIMVTILLLIALCVAKDRRPAQSGTLVQMDSVACGSDENSGKSLAGELIGTDGAHKKTHQVLCPEYVLQTDRLTYRIRPKDLKHPVLLPVGEHAQFHMQKDKMVLRVEDLDDKDRDYVVVSMTPRAHGPSDISQK